jgi:Spy/CpxP family protein refolding chaperone
LKKFNQEVSMKKWHLGLVVALSLVLATTVLAFGPKGGGHGCGGTGARGQDDCGGPGYGGGFGGHGAHMAKLDLSKEQMEKMWQLKEKFRNDTQALRYEMFQKRFDLRKLYADPNADNEALAAKQKEVTTLKRQLQDKMVQMRLEQRKILTPEQIKELGEAPFGGRFGHGKGHGSSRGHRGGDRDCGGCSS